MAQTKKPAAATQTTTANKPPKKLTPRLAPKTTAPAAPDKMPPTVAAQPPPAKAEPKAATTPAADKTAPQATAKPAAKPRVRKPSELDEINARNKKAMADALAKAQAVRIAQPLGRPVPPPDLPAKAKKPAKPAKVKKTKLVRDSFAMPEAEYALIAALKKRLGGLGQAVKKSELLRAGIAALNALNDAELQAVVGKVERIKTGRPAKAK